MAAEHPARTAAERSMKIVQEKGENAKDDWLALFADDGIVEDPVGASPLDPEGKGHRGKVAIGAFWDQVIGPVQIRFDIRASYACGNEVANVGTITTRTPDGTLAEAEGVFTYRVNAEGKIEALRAYWEFDRMLATMRRAEP